MEFPLAHNQKGICQYDHILLSIWNKLNSKILLKMDYLIYKKTFNPDPYYLSIITSCLAPNNREIITYGNFKQE